MLNYNQEATSFSDVHCAAKFRNLGMNNEHLEIGIAFFNNYIVHVRNELACRYRRVKQTLKFLQKRFIRNVKPRTFLTGHKRKITIKQHITSSNATNIIREETTKKHTPCISKMSTTVKSHAGIQNLLFI